MCVTLTRGSRQCGDRASPPSRVDAQPRDLHGRTRATLGLEPTENLPERRLDPGSILGHARRHRSAARQRLVAQPRPPRPDARHPRTYPRRTSPRGGSIRERALGHARRPATVAARSDFLFAPESASSSGETLNVNDPSAGSPTETLLRLLLPLDSQVRSSSRPAHGGPKAPAGPIQGPH